MLHFNAYFASSATIVLHLMSSVIVIGHIYDFLSVFQETTEMSCAGKDPTLSLIVPLYNYLLDIQKM